MSYIVDRGSPLFLTKLTDSGRKAIAQGDFNISYYGIGDSEVPYNAVDNTILRLLKTKDKQPDIKTFIQKGFNCESLHSILPTQVNVVRGRLYNKAKDRGFFDSNFVDTADLLTNEDYMKFSGTTTLDRFDGTKIWNIDGDISIDNFQSLNDGDIVLFKFYDEVSVNSENYNQTNSPVPYLFFSVKKRGALAELDVDRFLPYYSYLASADTLEIPYFVFPNKEDFLNYYSPSGRTVSWNSETLEFYEECSDNDVPILNYNNPICKDIIGTTGCTLDYQGYGSYDYISTMQYLDYCQPCVEENPLNDDCADSLINSYYVNKNSVGIIHFSNYNTRNEYGEYFYITDDKRFYLHMPSLMWHGREFSGSSTGDKLGMSFVSATGDPIYIQTQRQNIEYYDLVEDERYISNSRAPIKVGKIFPELKIVVIEHGDLIIASSYKSNRNWTLPRLKGKQIFPVNGVGNGVLQRGKRMYVTYMLKSLNGVQNTLPQGQIMVFDNDSQTDRDIEFQLEDRNFLPYMRQREDVNYDGFGFYANEFIVLYQIQDIGVDPDASAWNMLNFTTNNLTGLSGSTISPIKLESQNPADNNFYITNYIATNYDEGIYSNDFHCIACDSSYLTMGDERFFFGNLETYIGANVYKWIVNLTLDESFVETENDTYESGDFYFSEIGFYNNQKELMMTSKLSKPIQLRNGTKTEVEISMDF